MTEHLSDHHRHTLAQIAEHPTSHNVEWPQVESLLRATGAVENEHNGKVRIRVGDASLVVAPPRHKNLDEDLLISLKKLLRAAGYLSDAG